MNRMELDHRGNAGSDGGSGTLASHQLLVTLFNRAQEKVAEARSAIENRETRLKGELLRSAISNIDVIRGGLDYEGDGELAFNLASLYDHIERLLVEANVLSDPTLLDEVSLLLDQMKSGRSGIALAMRRL